MTNASIKIQKESHAQWTLPDFPRVEKVLRLVKKHCPNKGNALDLGYCPGSFSDYLQKEGWQCVGVDICRRNNASFPIVVGDVTQLLPFRDGSFDLITAGELIEHTIDQAAFLKECFRVLKPSGTLILTTPNMSYSLNRILVLAGRLPMFVTAPYHFHFHNKRSLLELLSSSHFKVIHLSASHVLYSRRLHASGFLFEKLADWFPAWGAHLIVCAVKNHP